MEVNKPAAAHPAAPAEHAANGRKRSAPESEVACGSASEAPAAAVIEGIPERGLGLHGTPVTGYSSPCGDEEFVRTTASAWALVSR